MEQHNKSVLPMVENFCEARGLILLNTDYREDSQRITACQRNIWDSIPSGGHGTISQEGLGNLEDFLNRLRLHPQTRALYYNLKEQEGYYVFYVEQHFLPL